MFLVRVITRFFRHIHVRLFKGTIEETIRSLDVQILQFKILRDKYGIELTTTIQEVERTRNLLQSKVDTYENWLRL